MSNGTILMGLDFPIVRNGLAAFYDAGNNLSYPGSGTTWNDISGNGYSAATLINGPTYNSNNKGVIVLDGVNDFISISGSATVYTSDFTWQSFHFIRSANGSDLDAMWWSEAGVKNFLMAYRNTALVNTYLRIDTGTTVYQSPTIGTQTNGFGTTAGPATGRWILTTIVKNGTTFSLYWNNAVLMWTVTINDWNIAENGQAIAFGARNDADFATAMDVSNNLMYNRALSTLEITQNYDSYKSRFGL